MPSIADLIFVGTLCVLVFTPLSVRLLNDAGTGWHIRTGQQILATHAIPRVDSFSSTMAGNPWFAWEWLYDMVVGYLDAAWGLNGPVWFTATIIATVFAGLFRLIVQRGTDLFTALVFVLLGVSASMIHFLARPHVLSWLFTLIVFSILDSNERDCLRGSGRNARSKLWLIPVAMLLWVNLHGGFLLGFVLLAIFWVSALWTWIRLRESRIEESLQKISAAKRARHLTLLGGASVAASLVNPYGWRLHAHILSYLSNRFLMDHIDEFQSPNFHGAAQKCFLALVLICIGVLLIRGRELRASGVLTVLFAVYAGLFASRNIPFSCILLTLVVAPLIPTAVVFRHFIRRMQAVDSGLRGHLWPIVAFLVTLVIAAQGGKPGSGQLMDAHFDPVRMPVGAVDFLSTERSNGTILSPDYWGGYLIYRIYPRNRVVVDDRHDLYGAAFLQSYLKMMHVEDGWDALLRRSDPSFLLLPRNGALANIVAKTAGWRSIYADPVSIVFARDNAVGVVPPVTGARTGN